MANPQNFNTIGIPNFGNGFEYKAPMPITGEGVINRFDRTLAELSLKHHVAKFKNNPALKWGDLLIKKFKDKQNKNNQAYRKAMSRNKDIAKLQLQLYELGYYPKGTTYEQAVDGVNGRLTLLAIAKYQLTPLLEYTEELPFTTKAIKAVGKGLETVVKAKNHRDNLIYKYAVSPVAEAISPRYGLPAVAYYRGIVDSNNPIYLVTDGANWEDSMLGPKTAERFKQRIKNGESTYANTVREGSAAADDVDYGLSNLIGGYTNHNREYATDAYDWKNYGTLNDAVTKFRRNALKGPTGVISGTKNVLEWMAPYIMTAEKGRSKATHQDTGKPVESFTDEELKRINLPWQTTPKIVFKVK